MKRPVALAVTVGASSCAALLEELAAAGHRAGWLELAALPASPSPELEAAAAAGVLRAVAVGGGRVTTVKPVRGPAVFDDLLREHFRGCRLVLVRGGEGLVRLEPEGDGWRLVPAAGAALRLTTAELVESLGRPSLWRRLGSQPAAGQAAP